MALVVVGNGAAAAALERQARLGAVERLDLALLIDRKHDGMGRWIDVEPDDVAQLGGEVRVVGELELPQTVRLQPMGAPDPLHGADADPDLRSHCRRGPMRLFAGRRGEGESDHVLRDGMRDGRVLSRSKLSTPASMNRSCQRQTAVLATPACRMISAVPCPSAVSNTIRARQTCFCGLLRSAAMAGKPLTVRGSDIDDGSGAHAPDSHVAPSRENPKRIRPSECVH
jgi:hypothetical protein